MQLGKNDDNGDESTDGDLTAEMLEWAKDRLGAVSESAPGKMAPLEASMAEPEPKLPPREIKPRRVESPEVCRLKPEPKLLVVELHEDSAERGQVYLLPDGPEASDFIETLLNNGLAPGRIAVLRGVPMTVSVKYRPTVMLGQPERKPPAANQ